MLDTNQTEAALSTADTTVVIAGPGSGKTTTLVGRVEALVARGDSPERLILLTFTNAGAHEIATRLKAKGITVGYAGTLHGYCFRLLQEYGTLLGYRRGRAVSLIHPEDTRQMVKAIADRLKVKLSVKALLEDTGSNDSRDLVLKEYAHQLKRNNMIDYDGLLAAARRILQTDVANVLSIDEVLIDEAQDSGIQDWLIYSALPGRKFIVGDPDQCQPAGTAVTLSDGSCKAIESISAGDKVLSYDRHAKSFIRSANVTQVARRQYNGLMYSVTAAGRTTRCTENHKWLVKWPSGAERNRSRWCVYMMRKGDSFRIGKTCLFRSGSGKGDIIGLPLRMRQEKANQGWVLTIHATEGEALAQEAVVSAVYGITQTCFTSTPVSRGYTQEVIDSIFASIPNQLGKAIRCLSAHGRSLNYPLFCTSQKRTRRTLQEVQACNLLAGVMMVPVIGGRYSTTNRAGKWETIDVSHKEFSGPVFSIDVEKYHKYVADGLLTCNSIYAFRGGDPSLLVGAARTRKVVALSQNYRSRASICDVANKLIQHNVNRVGKTMFPNTIQSGTVEAIGYDDDAAEINGTLRRIFGIQAIPDMPSVSIAVLARTNAVAASMRQALAASGVKLEESRSSLPMPPDWQQCLMLLNLLLNPENDFLMEKFIRWNAPKQMDGIRRKAVNAGSSMAAAMGFAKLVEVNLEQIPEALARMGISLASVDLVRQRLDLLPQAEPTLADLVSDLWRHDEWDQEASRGGVYCGTVHGFKGREADVVFVIGMEEGVFPKLLKDEAKNDLEEERRLAFVAFTRARHHLIVSHCSTRMEPWGNKARVNIAPSRFIGEAGL